MFGGFIKKVYLCRQKRKERNNMEAIADNNTVFNPIQQHLLMMFSHMNSEEQLTELKKALADFYFNQVEKGMAELEAKGAWSKEKCEEIAKEHLRTPYTY